MSYIVVDHLCKEYRIAQTEKGFSGAIKSLFHRKYTVKKAVNNISFVIEKGESVGYIGPNGAGKSTTIKMLSGILIPSSGTITVGGIIPYNERKENAKHIGVVFGQRSQLYWDLPLSDTLDLYKYLYPIPYTSFKKNCDFYIELFGLNEFMHQPVRQLSLGQKMKANIAIALLHEPDILYLDEPTIGLDLTSKKIVRDSLKTINKLKQTTIILTTHDMDDIEAVCDRLILIDQGEKLFDGSLREFRTKYDDGLIFKLEFEKGAAPIWQNDCAFEIIDQNDHQWIIGVPPTHSSKEAMIELINRFDPINLYVSEKSIEEIVRKIYSSVHLEDT
ncbi:ATP-binding cassette domain-containing protein [Oscillospiraceae bacterium 42-9]|uniref:ABC transporter ATP-binding protein n=1 Tax=Acutalibacter sp. 1XD8-36 TaxID=2320852 RepID=UPI0014132033|nr:ATP-binding cassette domain-containing protein [Acutalibacter sp. 1XD8-36]NBJ90141.1 ATP-binding cassette domain-containing protein [Acutalibacter sp. 1XD8-36]